MALAFGAATALAGTGGVLPEEAPRPAPLVEREEVRLVTLDLFVEEKTPGAGWRFARDLRPDQVTVQVGEREMPLDFFENLCAPAPQRQAGAVHGDDGGQGDHGARDPAAERDVDGAPAQGKQGTAPPRRYVLYFDLEHLTLAGLHDAARAALRWADREAGATDEVMIVTGGYGVRIARPMTPADARLRSDIENATRDLRAGEMWGEGEAARVDELRERRDPALAAAYARTDYSETRHSLRNLHDLMALFEKIPGTKNLLLFAETIRMVPGREYPAHPDHLSDMQSNLETFAEAADERDVRVYPVQTNRETWADDAYTRLAERTGGRYIERARDVGVVFDKVAEDLSCAYRIGFRVRPSHSGKTEMIAIRVRDGGRTFRVRHRQSLHDPTIQEQDEDSVRAAFLDPAPAPGLPITLSAVELFRHAGGSRVRLEVSVPLESLLAVPAPGARPGSRETRLQIGGQVLPLMTSATSPKTVSGAGAGALGDVAIDRKSWGFGTQATLTLPPPGPHEKAPRRAMRSAEIDAPPGRYRVIAVVQDQLARVVSSARTEFDAGEPASPLGEIGLASEDPESVVLEGADPGEGEGDGAENRNPEVERSGKSGKWDLSPAPPLLPARSVVIRNGSEVAAGHAVHFFYAVCEDAPEAGKDKRSKSNRTRFDGWRLARTLACGVPATPLPPRTIPEPLHEERCVPILETVAADRLAPGACRFEVVLDRPGHERDVRTLEFSVATAARPVASRALTRFSRNAYHSRHSGELP